MTKVFPAIAALTLAGAFLGSPAPAMAAAPACAKVIDGFYDLQLAVGITKTKTAELAVFTLKNCDVEQATAVVKAPRKTYRVTLTKTSGDPSDATDKWAGTISVHPKALRNTDAGVWRVTYDVTGATSDSASIDGHLRRGTRASFNAGPEPVRNNRITFSGKLERADWTTHRYRGIARSIAIQATGPDEDEPLTVATLTTRKVGTYRHTQRFPGPHRYWMSYAGTSATAGTSSKPDWVAAP
jgi:hypothetical protein